MSIKRKNTAVYSANRQKNNRKPIRKLPLIIGAGVLVALTLAITFAQQGETFEITTKASDNSSSTLRYEVLTEPDSNGDGGTVMVDYCVTANSTVVIPETVTYTPPEESTESQTEEDANNESNDDSTDAQNESNGEENTDNTENSTNTSRNTSSVSKTYTVTEIGENAFSGINRILTLEVPESITEIHDNAFLNCYELTTIKGLAGNANVKIAEKAFSGCYYLNAATLPAISTKNPAPFGEKGTDYVDISVELRGAEYYNIWYGSNYSDPLYRASDIKRIFNNGVYPQFTFTTSLSTGYELVCLKRFASAEAAAKATDYSIDTSTFTFADGYNSTSKYPKLTFDTDDFNNWKANPVLLAVAAKQGATGPAPSITTDADLNAYKDTAFEIQLEAENENATGAWSATGLPTGAYLDADTGKLTGNLSIGEYKFKIKVVNNYSYHEKEFTLIVKGEAPDTSKTPLGKPLNTKWDATTFKDHIYAKWDALAKAEGGYKLQLYKVNSETGTGEKCEEALTVKKTADGINPQYDFTTAIKEKGEGTYYFTVTGLHYDGTADNNETATSTNYIYSLNSDLTSYIITASADAGGTITPSGNVTVAKGGAQEFTITADEGYEILSLTVDGTEVPKASTYKFENIDANHEIKASFALITNKIGDVAASYPKGNDVTFSAIGYGMDNTTPATGDIRYMPSTWRLDKIALQTFDNETYKDTFSTKDLTKGKHTLQVKFKKQQYDGTQWIDTAEIDTKEVSFEVTSALSIGNDGSSSDTGNSDSTNGSGTSTDTNSDTSGNDSSANGSSGNSSSSGISGAVNTVTNLFKNPQTGDVMPVRIVFAAAVLALIGIIAAAVFRRKPKAVRRKKKTR